MPDLLQVESLSKRFGGIVATDDLSIAIPEGQLHAVIGPNGAGKTTLIAQLSGQLTPDSGRIQFDGSDLTTLSTPMRSAPPNPSCQELMMKLVGVRHLVRHASFQGEIWYRPAMISRTPPIRAVCTPVRPADCAPASAVTAPM